MKEHSISAVICDFSPLRVPVGWVRDVGIELDHLGVPLVQVRRGQNLYTCRCSEENITDISSDNALFMMGPLLCLLCGYNS